MAQQPLTWISPLRSGSATIDKILQSLTEWLARWQPSEQSGSTPVTTNGSGQATISFTTFPNSCTTVTACPGTGAGGFAMCSVISFSNGSFTVECWNATGVLLTTANLTVNWIATGT